MGEMTSPGSDHRSSRSWVRAGIVALALALVTGVPPAGGQQPPPEAHGAEVVIMLKSPLGPTKDVPALRRAAEAARRRFLAALPATIDLTVTLEFETIPALTVTVGPDVSLDEIRTQPNVRSVDLDLGAGGGSLANTVPIVGADDLHAAGTTGAGTTVAVLDSGHDSDHPDLVGSTVHEACFGSNNSGAGVGFCPNGSDRQTGAGSAEDDAGHGTHVTGIVTSDGVVSSIGVAPGSSIVALKVTDDCNFSGCFYAFSEITAALDYLVAHPELGVDVVNMSLTTNDRFAGDCDSSTAWLMAGATAVNNLRAAGVSLFAAAGNNGSTNKMTAPACLQNVTSVGATSTSDAIASFSNTSTTTDILAPGVNVVSDAIGGGTFTASGTSMASPASAGCAALIAQAVPAASPADVDAALESTGTSVARGTASFPRINCAAARQALGGTSTHQLSVTTTGTGTGTVTSSPAGIDCGSTCQANFSSGQQVTLTATAASGSTFGGWSGACTGSGSCTVTMNQARSVTATFTSSPTSCTGTVNVNVSATSFTPKTAKAQVGGCVVWNFNGPGNHSATETKLLGPGTTPLFNSGSKAPGTTFSYTFVSAGGYNYRSTMAGDPSTMVGVVKVPVKLSATSGGVNTSITVTWASASTAGYRSDVQLRYKPAGGSYGAWTNWRVDQTGVSDTFIASAANGAGVYQFRARYENAGTAKASGYSTAATLRIS